MRFYMLTYMYIDYRWHEKGLKCTRIDNGPILCSTCEKMRLLVYIFIHDMYMYLCIHLYMYRWHEKGLKCTRIDNGPILCSTCEKMRLLEEEQLILQRLENASNTPKELSESVSLCVCVCVYIYLYLSVYMHMND
jgi:hypothetical protein